MVRRDVPLKLILCVRRRIYAELADQYKRMSPTHTKRHILAEHLKEVIDTMEEKVSASLRVGDVT